MLANDRAGNRRSELLRRLAGITAMCCALLFCVHARADVVIPAGGFMGLAAGGLDLGCTDLIVGGTLQTNSAPVSNVRNLIIQAGGVIDAGTSTITVGGNWTNNGTFTAGASLVIFNDLCGVNPAVISGNTSFYNVTFTSNAGKTWQFAAGSAQSVQYMLTIAGTAANPVQFRSTVPGQTAFINLLAFQNIAHVGVTDVWATGAWLAPYLNNEGGSGNANRWFGVPDYARIPTLSPLGIAALLLLLSAAICHSWSRRTRRESIRSTRK